MKNKNIYKGKKLICTKPKVLVGYYNSKYTEGEQLIITNINVPYTTKMPKSQFFHILSTGKFKPNGEEIRFSVANHELTKHNFTEII
jgi:hypothetical protein